jgi:hypothetical protein
MVYLLLSIIILTVLAVWNASEYINAFGNHPPLRKLFYAEIQVQYRRAYIILLTVGVGFLFYGLVILSRTQNLVVLFSSNIGDISLVAIFVTVFVNYLFRLKVYISSRKDQAESRKIYMWEVWAIKRLMCESKVDRRNLWLSNSSVVLSVLGYIFSRLALV